jgi:hypothetical protein
MLKYLKLTSMIAISAAGAALSLSQAAHAYPNDSYSRDEGRHEEWQVRRHEMHGQFLLGVCVGQTLAQQGLTLPEPQPGQQPQPLDPNTQAALKSAIQTCRAQRTSATGTPAPLPSQAPTSPGGPAQPAPVPTATATS